MGPNTGYCQESHYKFGSFGPNLFRGYSVNSENKLVNKSPLKICHFFLFTNRTRLSWVWDLCLFTLTHMSIMRRCFHLMLVPLHGTVLLTGKLSVAAEGNSLRGVHVLLSHIWLCNSVSHLKSTLKYRLCVSAAFCLWFSQAKNTMKSTLLQF